MKRHSEVERAVPAARLTVVPDPRKRLSDGVLVEACLRARLLGIPLLKVEATIALAPAGLTAPPSGRRSVPVQKSSRSPAPAGTPGQGLIEARRTIDEGAELLVEARNGS